MPLRIAFDLDGVLADLDGELCLQADRLFGPGGSESQGDVAPADLTPRQRNRLWRHVESVDRFWESLREMEPGVVSRIAELATLRRWEVLFLTRRPECAGATAQIQSQRWLDAHGYPLPSVYVVQGSRGRIAAALELDFVVDDRVENCLDVASHSRARAILVWRGDEPTLPPAAKRLGVHVVRSVQECLDVLIAVERAPQPRAGVVGRFLRLLGLKEPAGA